MIVLAVVLVVAGAAFLAVSAVGLIRFPDFYTRAHVVAKSETLGITLVVAGLIAYRGLEPGVARMLIVLAFAVVANPVAVHALAGAARSQEMLATGRAQTSVEPVHGDGDEEAT